MDLDWLNALRLILLLAVSAGLLFTAWRDFQTFRIHNSSVLGLTLLAAGWGALSGFDGLAGQLGAAGLLFGMGFVFWLLGLLGAGDAKLLLPVGLVVGWNGLAVFAVALLLFSVAAVVVIKLPIATANARMAEIRSSRRFPYGTIIAFAALAGLFWPYSRDGVLPLT